MLNVASSNLLFVDPRYHIQAQAQAHKGVKVIKMKMGDKFLSLLKKHVKKGNKILIDEKFIKLSSYRNMLNEFSGYCEIIEGDFEKNKKTSKRIRFKLYSCI